jgi:hypothetical protein
MITIVLLSADLAGRKSPSCLYRSRRELRAGDRSARATDDLMSPENNAGVLSVNRCADER